MSSVLIHNARILTLAQGSVPRRGAEARDLAVIERGHVLLSESETLNVAEGDPPAAYLTGEVQTGSEYKNTDHVVIDARGRVVMPAFIDAHTHACFAGDRLDEWDRKRAGASYLDILSSGGGIMSTVRAVRATTREELTTALLGRLDAMRSAGTTACEVKSGYGLRTDAELKMLRAIQAARQSGFERVVLTALLGHAIDPERPGFVDSVIDDTLPAVCEEFPRITIDAYCEEGAWSVDDCRWLFEKAISLGHPFRVHADQFNSLGMTPIAVEMGARSVDHLEASTEVDLKILAESDTFGVMLPACGFHLDDRYANGRLFMDMGGALVVASNDNPGSAPCFSMPFVIALAVRKLGLSIEEAITSCTVNAAALLAADDATATDGFGQVRPGPGATSLLMLRHTDERMLAYEFGGDPIDLVIDRGRIVSWRDHERGRGMIER